MWGDDRLAFTILTWFFMDIIYHFAVGFIWALKRFLSRRVKRLKWMLFDDGDYMYAYLLWLKSKNALIAVKVSVLSVVW